MGPIAKWLASAALAGCLVVTWNARHSAAQQRTRVIMTRLYTGPDGLSYAEDVEMKVLPTAAASPTAVPTESAETVKVTGVQFRRQAPGYVNDWHTAPRRQYVITLNGRSEVELSGGQKVLYVPGKVVLAEDLTGKGHITRVIGTEDYISVTIPLANK